MQGDEMWKEEIERDNMSDERLAQKKWHAEGGWGEGNDVKKWLSEKERLGRGDRGERELCEEVRKREERRPQFATE